jgi:hypothetical protein
MIAVKFVMFEAEHVTQAYVSSAVLEDLCKVICVTY